MEEHTELDYLAAEVLHQQDYLLHCLRSECQALRQGLLSQQAPIFQLLDLDPTIPWQFTAEEVDELVTKVVGMRLSCSVFLVLKEVLLIDYHSLSVN